MKITTLLAKHYDIEITEESDSVITCIDVYEQGEHSENIGTLFQHTGHDGKFYYQWRRISGPVAHGTAYTDEALRKAIKARAFG